MITSELRVPEAPATPRVQESKAGMLAQYAGATVICFGAHPDDIELGMGGTVAILTRLGARVTFVVCSVPGNSEVRRAEAVKAAKILGADVEFMFPGSGIRLEELKTYELKDRISAICRRREPAAVFSHGPADFHKDHAFVHQTCLDALATGTADLYCYGPTSTRPNSVPFRPQVYVDISETIDLKIDAIHVHSSQFGKRGLAADFLRVETSMLGKALGMGYAEGFQLVRLRLHRSAAPAHAGMRRVLGVLPACDPNGTEMDEE